MAAQPDDTPFAAPKTRIGDPSADLDMADEANAEPIRLRFLSRESSIKSLGLFCFLCGAASVVIAVMATVLTAFPGKLRVPPGMAVDQFRAESASTALLGYVIAIIGFGLGYYGLWGLRAWARRTWLVLSAAAILYEVLALLYVLAFRSDFSVLVLVDWLIMLLIFGYVFHLLAARESVKVCSAAYRLVVARTPEIRCFINPIVKALLILLSALVVLMAIAAIARLFR